MNFICQRVMFVHIKQVNVRIQVGYIINSVRWVFATGALLLENVRVQIMAVDNYTRMPTRERQCLITSNHLAW